MKHSEHEALSIVNKLRVSPRKLNEVLATIRRKPVNEALNVLRFSRKRIAKSVEKALMSAIANGENNHALDPDRLVVSGAFVGKSLVMRRYRPRARGRASPIKKPFSRLTIIVSERQVDETQAGTARAGKARGNKTRAGTALAGTALAGKARADKDPSEQSSS